MNHNRTRRGFCLFRSSRAGFYACLARGGGCDMTLRLATFNVENLFERDNALNTTTCERGLKGRLDRRSEQFRSSVALVDTLAGSLCVLEARSPRRLLRQARAAGFEGPEPCATPLGRRRRVADRLRDTDPGQQIEETAPTARAAEVG